VLPHAPPAVQPTQLPLPSHTWLVPQLMPAGAVIWLQTAVPLVQSYTPGLQVVPHPPATFIPLQVPPCVPAVPP
jgi:hypothetical protein